MDMMAYDNKGKATGAGIPKTLFPVPGLISGSRFAMSNDGQEFIIPLAPQSGGRPSVTTVLNWNADIKK